jgi:di/tricarboxylate transporter
MNQSLSLKNKNTIKWAINIILPLLIALIPTTEAFTQPIKLFFCITLFGILLIAFETINLTITALALPVVYVITKLAPADVAFKSWSLDVTWLLLGGFMFTFALESTGFMKRLAFKSILLTGGKFKSILYGLTLSGILAALIIPDAGARTVIYTALTVGICKALELKPKGKASSAIMIAGIFAALNPGYLFLTGSGQTIIPFGLVKDLGISVTFIEYMQHMFVPVLIWSIINVVLLDFLFKPDEELKSKEYFKEELKKLGSVKLPEIKLIVILAAIVVLLLTSSVHNISVGWIFLLAGCLLYLPGVNVGKTEDLGKINYGFIIFVTACLTIGIVSMTVGAGKFVADALYPYLGGSNVTSFGGVWLLAVVLNFVLTPLAACSALAVPIVELSNNLGVNPIPMLYTFIQGIEQILLPYEYALILLPFSYGLISLKNLVKTFGIRMILSIITIIVIFIPYWNLIGLL